MGAIVVNEAPLATGFVLSWFICWEKMTLVSRRCRRSQDAKSQVNWPRRGKLRCWNINQWTTVASGHTSREVLGCYCRMSTTAPAAAVVWGELVGKYQEYEVEGVERYAVVRRSVDGGPGRARSGRHPHAEPAPALHQPARQTT